MTPVPLARLIASWRDPKHSANEIADGGKICADELEALLAEHEQQPVAWAIYFCGLPADFFVDESQARAEKERRDREYLPDSRELIPLYSSPQPAKEAGDAMEAAKMIRATFMRDKNAPPSESVIAAIITKHGRGS